MSLVVYSAHVLTYILSLSCGRVLVAISPVVPVIQDYLTLGSRNTVTNIWLRINDLSFLWEQVLCFAPRVQKSVFFVFCFFICIKFRFKTLPQILRYFGEKRFQAEGI